MVRDICEVVTCLHNAQVLYRSGSGRAHLLSAHLAQEEHSYTQLILIPLISPRDAQRENILIKAQRYVNIVFSGRNYRTMHVNRWSILLILIKIVKIFFSNNLYQDTSSRIIIVKSLKFTLSFV